MQSLLRRFDLPAALLGLLLAGSVVGLVQTVPGVFLMLGGITIPGLLVLAVWQLATCSHGKSPARELPSADLQWLERHVAVNDPPDDHPLQLAVDAGEDWGAELEVDLDVVVQQSWRRTIDQSGAVAVSGQVLLSFEPGARTATAHLTCQPPLPLLPVALGEMIEGDEVTVQFDDIRRYGVKLVARREGSVEREGWSRIEFYIGPGEQTVNSLRRSA